MTTVLLRCLDTGQFELPDGRALDAAQLAWQLPSTAKQTPVLNLLLPAVRCLLATVPVTRQEEKLLHKTLPWLLEDRLLEPAEHLQVASGPVRNGQAAVGAIDGAWLQSLLAALAAQGLGVQTAASELLYLPWQQGQWTILVQAAPAACLVRHAEHGGFACSVANLHTALQLLLNESMEPPAQVLLNIPAAMHTQVAVLLPTLLQSRLSVKQQAYWDIVRSAAVTPLQCNLLQDRYAPRLPWPRLWQQWRVAAALLAGLWLADLGVTALETFKLKRQIAANESALVARYRSVAPDGAVVDPRLHLEQAIVALGGSAHPGFLTLLSRMQPVLAALPQARVASFDYDGSSGELQFTVETQDFAAAETLRSRLQELGLNAELLGSTSDGANSRTRLKVGG